MHHDKCCHMTSEAVAELTSLLQLLLMLYGLVSWKEKHQVQSFPQTGDVTVHV